MTFDLNTFEGLKTPYYILEEKRLRRNLELIKSIADKACVEIILAFKAYALWKTFPVFKEYINSTTASSLYEARLAYDKFGSKAHTYSPAYTDYEIREIARCSSHLTFNSLSQYANHRLAARSVNPDLSFGLRINPEYSEIETDLYNPCSPGTRFGITADKLPDILPCDIKGFHCHCHCESGSDVFERTLYHIEKKFSKWFGQIEWINFGGGHLVTREDYDIDLLINILNKFHDDYPSLKVILEPGSAFGWQTGTLVSQVVDIVEDHGVKTAILNVSFTCHMPDCLEMPYIPAVRGAKIVDNANVDCLDNDAHVYRLGGNSCLSGDFLGYWKFPNELKNGDNVIFEDMLHYTTVKTNMFNGIAHPSIAFVHLDGKFEVLKKFTFEDYLNRMD
ncbi:carboxynorspermidine decarboxylase [uncultured Prevotella sp.]|uniref:carboxynorspermidine decarboxylase n=1 Tax=uncultured Prevotella sp. TaxID=159272 RepID=UPI00260F9AF9|nr:carboxynorspermidine decarboxylase [uncultured Prevotella sp.]